MYATFEASADALSSSGNETAGDARELLPILAVCGPSRLPLDLFEAGWKKGKTVSPDTSIPVKGYNTFLTAWHASRLPSLLSSDTDTWDSFRLVEAVHLLKSFSLVSTDTSDGCMSVSMHALVHAWARDRQSKDEQHAAWLKMGCLVALSSSDGALWRDRARQLQSHLRALTSWEMVTMFGSEPVSMIVSILDWCGVRFETMRDDTMLSRLLQKLFEYLRIVESKVDEEWLPLYFVAGRNLQNCGRPQEAVKMLEGVLEIRVQRQKWEKNNKVRLDTQLSLTQAYKRIGQLEKAMVMLEEVVRIRRQTLAEDDQDRLTSELELAMSYVANGETERPMMMLEEVVRINKQILAEDHPELLASQYALGMACVANGEVKRGMMIQEEVVRIQGQILAEDNPKRLASQHALATAYSKNGQGQEAVTMLEVVVRIKGQIMAEDHPSRLASEHGLAVCLWRIGQRAEAITMMEEVVRVQQYALDEQHPRRINSEDWLERWTR